MTRFAAAGAMALTILALAVPVANAAPTADSTAAYQALGRVFPDPLAGCQNIGASPCSPNALGNIPAAQFIGYDEFIKAIGFMNTQPQWQRYMEVWPLDGKLGDGAGTAKAPDVPGNNLEPEFKPDPKNVSAGLPTTTGDRQKHDLIVIRVTDESVPDAGKKRYALSLSIHGIERAGVEGGTRAMEDLVTSYTTGLATKTVVPKSVDPAAPTFGDVLKHTIIYFTYPNPDGWARGQVSAGSVFFQRYNGNGVDVNRDWPDIGFSFRPYSGLSEPESRALSSFLNQVKTGSGAFAAGDDLHGQPEADALSYTLLPHGSHPFDKDIRIRETAKTIHKNSEQALKWSPIIQADDQPRGGGAPCTPDGPTGTVCSKIYGQTWGSVYDTINYTTTGALGDYFDSSVGLGADGIDNEMSFSHLDKNIVFEPNTEQLHVDGNKALIYAHLAELSHPATGAFDAPGVKGYVPNKRVKAGARDLPAVAAGDAAARGHRSAGDVRPARPERVGDPADRQRRRRRDLQRRHARRHHGDERAGRRRRRHDARRPVPELRHAPVEGPGREARRLDHGRRGLQPVAGLPPGRADGGGQRARTRTRTSSGGPSCPRPAARPRRTSSSARARRRRTARPAATARRASGPTTWPTPTSSSR